ncbi:MAG TPA: hypothetical protein VIV11_29555 [Kofleriaceae bacterium]
MIRDQSPRPAAYASAPVARPPVVSMRPPPAAPAKPIVLAATTYHDEISATHIYWTQASYDDSGVIAHLMRAPIGGGLPELIANDASYGFVIAGDSIYYVSTPQFAIRRVSLGGGDSTLVASSPAEPYAIAAGGGYVYWTSARGVMRAPASGGTAVRLGAGRAQDPIAADAEYLYIGGRKLERIAHGETAATTLAKFGDQPSDLVVTQPSLIIAVGSSLVSVPREGGKAERLAIGGAAHRLAHSGGTVYWTTWGDPRAQSHECDGFQLGTVRRVDVELAAVEHVTSGCDVRGYAVGPTAAFIVDGSRLVRQR